MIIIKSGCQITDFVFSAALIVHFFLKQNSHWFEEYKNYVSRSKAEHLYERHSSWI